MTAGDTVAPLTTSGSEDRSSAGGEPWSPPPCEHDPRTADFAPLSFILGWAEHWATYSANDFGELVDDALDDLDAGRAEAVGDSVSEHGVFAGALDLGPIAPTSLLRGSAPERLLVLVRDARASASAHDAFELASFVVGFAPTGITEIDDRGDSAYAVFAVTESGRIVFVQACFEAIQAEFDAFSAEEMALPGWTGIDRMEGLLRGDPAVERAYSTWLDIPAPPEWDDLPPEERLLDPEVTPREVLDQLDLVTVVFEVPEAWEGRSELLCTRVSLGWNECVSLALVEHFEVVAYAVPGESLEVVVLPASADVTSEVAWLGEIPARGVQAAREADEPIVVRILAPTLEAAIEASGRGEPSIEP